MDEILVNNFMVFHDVVEETPYDLVIGDEAWDVDYFLHENPELKRFAFAWMTDFVGWLPMPDGGDARGAAHRRLQRRDARAASPASRGMRDRSIFVGNPEDVVDEPFGPGLPEHPRVDESRTTTSPATSPGSNPARTDEAAPRHAASSGTATTSGCAS